MADYQTILYAQTDDVATICLNRPHRRNALTREMLSELQTAVTHVAQTDALRCLILTGSGQGFCAGQDLSAFDAGDGATTISGVEVRDMIKTVYKPLIMTLCTLPKPVIAAVNGVAAGAGASLALACDLRIMADDASIMQAFINIGLVPDAGSTWFLARLVGYARAFEIAIAGERIAAQRCLELGLANRIAPAADLMRAATDRAAQLASRPTLAIGMTKQLLYQALTHTLSDAIDLEAEHQAQAVGSADHREGVRAFQEKRPPVFQGN